MGYSPWGCKRAGHDLATKQQVLSGTTKQNKKKKNKKRTTKRKVEAEVEGITLKSGKEEAGLRYQQGMERKDLFWQ